MGNKNNEAAAASISNEHATWPQIMLSVHSEERVELTNPSFTIWERASLCVCMTANETVK